MFRLSYTQIRHQIYIPNQLVEQIQIVHRNRTKLMAIEYQLELFNLFTQINNREIFIISIFLISLGLYIFLIIYNIAQQNINKPNLSINPQTNQSMLNINNNSRLTNNFPSYKPKHDINYLLNCYNELDTKNTGYISLNSTRVFFRSLDISNDLGNSLTQNSNQKYQFDRVLSILGTIEQPNEPSVYVIAFVKELAQFKKSFLLDEDQQIGLEEANQIDKKIKLIINNQIQRHSTRLQLENQKTLNQLQLNQLQQFKLFQEQWSSYIKQFTNNTKQKVHQTIDFRNKSLQNDQSRFVQTSRRRYSVLTSTKLTELQERKKRLVKQGKYNDALAIKQKIVREKQYIQQKQQNQVSFVATRRQQSLNKKKQSILETTIMTAHNNVEKLYIKKREGEHLLKIRMKSVREETAKKLQQNAKKQLARVKSLLHEATKG